MSEEKEPCTNRWHLKREPIMVEGCPDCNAMPAISVKHSLPPFSLPATGPGGDIGRMAPTTKPRPPRIPPRTLTKPHILDITEPMQKMAAATLAEEIELEPKLLALLKETGNLSPNIDVLDTQEDFDKGFAALRELKLVDQFPVKRGEYKSGEGFFRINPGWVWMRWGMTELGEAVLANAYKIGVDFAAGKDVVVEVIVCTSPNGEQRRIVIQDGYRIDYQNSNDRSVKVVPKIKGDPNRYRWINYRFDDEIVAIVEGDEPGDEAVTTPADNPDPCQHLWHQNPVQFFPCPKCEEGTPKQKRQSSNFSKSITSTLIIGKGRVLQLPSGYRILREDSDDEKVVLVPKEEGDPTFCSSITYCLPQTDKPEPEPDGAETLFAEVRFDDIQQSLYEGVAVPEKDVQWLVEQVKLLNRYVIRKDPSMWSSLDAGFMKVTEERDVLQRKSDSLETMVGYLQEERAYLDIELATLLRVIPEQDKKDGETNSHFWIRTVGFALGEYYEQVETLEELSKKHRWALERIKAISEVCSEHDPEKTDCKCKCSVTCASIAESALMDADE